MTFRHPAAWLIGGLSLLLAGCSSLLGVGHNVLVNIDRRRCETSPGGDPVHKCELSPLYDAHPPSAGAGLGGQGR
jgi:hypothetical protein